jgi:energy-coupling factor transport system ATP-binding protein
MARSIGYVFQNPDRQIFRDTIATEVAYGPEQLGFSPQEINQAVALALTMTGLTELAGSFPRLLSRGQKQKVAIARMFYRDSDILVLDEPSSALDPLSEYEFYNAMAEASAGNILVTVSHRLSSTKNADKILVLKNGRIIESGTHKQLMSNNGDYAHMFHLQAQRYNEILIERNDSIIKEE